MEMLFKNNMISMFSFLCAFLPLATSEIVSTKYGDIEGLVTSYPNASGPFKSVSKFLGVPFAAPPVGELRLKAPVPPEGWKPNVLQATKHGNICWQGKFLESYTKIFAPNFTYSEDCLYLDVYSPNVSQSLPVLFYIHGGTYEYGTALTYPSDLLALHGVVVVVIQYRLGPFGFFTTGDSAAPGNYGMLDQVQALKWVKENIANFGGDPSKVTIAGVSAGATSVSLHLMSPLSKGLFHQAIAESGVDLTPFAIQPVSSALRFANHLAEKLDCATNDHSAMLACILRQKDVDIQKASDTLPLGMSDNVRWGPVLDNHFLLDTPQNLREKGDFRKVNLMISFTSHEGAGAVGYMANKNFGMAESVDNGASPSFFKKFVTNFAHSLNSRDKTADLVADALEFMYTPWPDNRDKYALRSQLVDLIGDRIFFAPSHEVADIHSKYAPVYMYEFAHRPKNASMFPEWMGVAHGENVFFPFGIPLWFPRYDAADKNVSLFIMATYANFVKTGEPTPQPVSGVMWERYNSTHRAFLRVQTKPKMAAAFAPRRMAFWNDYYPKLQQVKFDTEKKVVSGGSANVAIVMLGYIALAIVFVLF